MPVITVNSQLSLKQYVNINLYMLARKRLVWIMALVCVALLAYLFSIRSVYQNNIKLIMLSAFLGLYFLSMPLLIYIGSVKNYKKIKALSEPKIYGFDDENIKIKGQTISLTMDWVHVDKIRERANYFLAITSNGKGVHFLPKAGFANEDAMLAFEILVKRKIANNNLK